MSLFLPYFFDESITVASAPSTSISSKFSFSVILDLGRSMETTKKILFHRQSDSTERRLGRQKSVFHFNVHAALQIISIYFRWLKLSLYVTEIILIIFP